MKKTKELLKRRTKKLIEENPIRERKDIKKTKGGKHSGGLTKRQRRKIAIKNEEKQSIRNPFGWCA